jgi:hypothetical protein
VLGAAILLVVLVVLLPVAILLGGAVVAAVMGWLLKEHAEATHQGSELVDLNV